MAVPSWSPRRPPEGELCWSWTPLRLQELAGIRWQLREGMTDLIPRPGAPLAEMQDVLILALDELLSNALRHGRPPVTCEVRLTAAYWVAIVADHAGETAPAPAVDRDPAKGGMGLHIVANLTDDRGWFTTGPRKHVWAAVRAR